MFEVEQLTSVADIHDEDEVRALALETDYLSTPLDEASLRVARLLLLRESSYAHAELHLDNKHDTPIERLVERLVAEDQHYRALMLSNWATGSLGKLPLYALYLYNVDYGHSREVLETLLLGERWAPPYLKLVLLNMLHQVVGLSHDGLHYLSSTKLEDLGPWLNRLFIDAEPARRWLEHKAKPLRFYGGVTNTVLGLYDDLFADPEVGCQWLARDAERYIDLGGGFSTAQMQHLLERPFVSHDLLSPRLGDHDSELILLDRRAAKRMPVADAAARREYLARQDRVAHRRFDVFTDSFEHDAQRYVITSTGFMTSNLRPQLAHTSKAIRAARLGTLSTSVHAIFRVMELVARGKSVDLFTVQRATSRMFRYKTCLLQWRDGRLVRLVTTDDPRSTGWRRRFNAIPDCRPPNPRFARIAGVPPPRL